MRRSVAVLVPALAAAALAAPAHADPVARCTELAGLAIPAAAIGLPTSGGTVTAAQVTGGYCQVDAALHPVDPAAPDIRMRVALPAEWNGKALMFGGGGYNGTIPNVAGNVPFGPVGGATPLARGYATFASDSGHQASPTHVPAPSLDGSFGVNDEAVRNFSGDALKKTRDAAVFVIAQRYSARPSYSYFAGGSTGGREALAVAQRWPADFDGVISVYPAWNAASLDLFFGYQAQVLSQPGAFPNPAKQALLYRSVIRACDGQDGLRDGVVSDEAGCRFDPRVLRCPGGADTGDACLSDVQIGAVKALSEPLRWKYRVASGERGYPGFPFLSGAAMTTPLLGMGTVAPATPMPAAAGYGVQFWDQWARYFVTRNPGFDALTLDPRRPGPWRERISELTALQDVNNADLGPFARAGGKLLLLHGTADELVSHRSTVDYFQRVERTLGKRATDSFARFYLVPGANHANVGAAFPAAWDSLTALETWTEHQAAPVTPVVTDAATGRTRPLCEYPAWPRYRGGDPATASSFSCARR
ncbi:tannase/feruloyl esterase family alpha/beta hydrolase [Amycolatopsis thermalba]|uniref:Tannase/feruloyl esterase family alpha/beta hydrolase n=1 Tax=Amycolatopsis thermalba TaxID=944492 RepID=A0ABY4NUU3_9PSEU|nr:MULTISPECIES: tannase/feruloyl esterase family alpha/beta hydrolase [Amycolatopsis]UQS23842.1 tannase/feruloyl esterase family alpha/beta hydrolase [Amycolatopsis thermalba]